MPTYILLLTLTPEGREKMLEDTQAVLRAGAALTVPGVQVLGQYGVLGAYDFVNVVEASDNETIARFSIELGVRAGVHVTTLPAIPVGRLGGATPHDNPAVSEEKTLSPPGV